jgi:hypothetical protein
VALPTWDEAASLGAEENTLLEASTDTEVDPDMDASTLFRDATEALEMKGGVLLIVEFDGAFRAAEKEAGTALLGSMLVGAGEGVADPLLAWAT